MYGQREEGNSRNILVEWMRVGRGVAGAEEESRRNAREDEKRREKGEEK